MQEMAPSLKSPGSPCEIRWRLSPPLRLLREDAQVPPLLLGGLRKRSPRVVQHLWAGSSVKDPNHRTDNVRTN